MTHYPFLFALLFISSIFSTFLTPQAHAQNVIITGMDDYNFGTYVVGSGNQQQTQANCIGKSSGNRNWTGTINGSGVGGAFTLSDGAGNTLPFTVRRTPNPVFLAGVPNSANQADNSLPLDCDGVDNQNFRIDLDAATLDSAPAGTYTGFIDITVTP